MKALAILLGLMAALGSARGATPEGDNERARLIVSARCAMCHGMQGQSVSTQFPKLSGQNPEYIVKQLFNFKTGLRTSTVMQPMTNDLTANEIHLLANYFSRQPAMRNPVEDPELATVGRYIFLRGNRWSGVSACVICHGAKAHGSTHLPRLAGQHAAYIEARLNLGPAATRATTLDVMHTSIAPITELEVKAVAQFLSGEE